MPITPKRMSIQPQGKEGQPATTGSSDRGKEALRRILEQRKQERGQQSESQPASPIRQPDQPPAAPTRVPGEASGAAAGAAGTGGSGTKESGQQPAPITPETAAGGGVPPKEPQKTLRVPEAATNQSAVDLLIEKIRQKKEMAEMIEKERVEKEKQREKQIEEVWKSLREKCDQRLKIFRQADKELKLTEVLEEVKLKVLEGRGEVKEEHPEVRNRGYFPTEEESLYVISSFVGVSLSWKIYNSYYCITLSSDRQRVIVSAGLKYKQEIIVSDPEYHSKFSKILVEAFENSYHGCDEPDRNEGHD